MTLHHPKSKSLMQATMETPQIARISELIAASNALRASIDLLLPAAIRPHVKAGPWDNETWCIFADNNAVAAKLRQLLPALEAHLRAKGWDIKSTRIKVVQKDNP